VKYKVQNTAKHVSTVAFAKKTSIDERSFVQFIIALRQIKANSRAAQVNIDHFKIGN